VVGVQDVLNSYNSQSKSCYIVYIGESGNISSRMSNFKTSLRSISVSSTTTEGHVFGDNLGKTIKASNTSSTIVMDVVVFYTNNKKSAEALESSLLQYCISQGFVPIYNSDIETSYILGMDIIAQDIYNRIP